jgi:Beta-propeller repeat
MRRVGHIILAVTVVGAVAAGIGIYTASHAELIRPKHHTSQRVAPQLAFSENHRQQALTAYGNLPLTFVENRGQTDRRVRYYAQRRNFGLYFTPEEVVFSFDKPSPTSGSVGGRFGPPVIPAALSAPQDQPSTGVVLALRFLQANSRVALEAEERAPGEVSYFRGNDPARWQTGVPQYSQVVYRELWPGVDLRLRDHEKSLKYEFRVRPGAQVSNIRLAYTGASGVRLDGSGALLIESPAGVMRDAPPVAWQEILGVRVPVESRYVLNAAGEYGFAIGAGYQPGLELIVDPGVAYSTFLGGTDVDNGTGIAVDASGNAYIVGTTQSADFPATVGAFKRTGAVGTFSDVFVAKLNPTGTALVYATYIGGSDFDWGRAIAIDAAGNAYITGQTKSHDFPTTRGAFDQTLNVLNCPRCAIDNYDAFVTKLNATGSALLYSTFLGGASDINDALGIAVDAVGSAYVTGETGAADFPVTPGAFRTIRNGAYDAYVTKLNPAGSALVYSTFIGGSAVDFGVRIAVDASNNAYVLGNTSSPDFPTTPGAFNTTNNGGFDIFVLKLNAAGSNLIYSTFIGGAGFDSAGGLAIDAAGNAYVSGAGSANYPTTPGAFQTVSQSGTGGVFVTKLNATGSALVYSTFLGDYAASSIALTPAGNVWVTGGTSSQNFPTTPDAFQGFFHPGIGSDAFITELNATGSAILYSTYLGGTNTDYGADVALDSAGNVYVTGETRSADFPTTANAFDQVLKGGQDAFITKLAVNGTPPPPPPLPTVAAVTSAQVVGGNSFAITVTLTSGAQGTGAVVALTSSNPAVLTVPANLTIPTGAQNATATATTSVVTASTPVTVTASYNNSSLGATNLVSPLPPPAALSSIGFFPNTVTGGTSALAGLSLTSPAGPGGFTVTLSANVPGIVTLPATITVAQGATSIAFQVPTAVVTTQTGLTVFATAGGVQQLAPLFVNPAAPPPPPTVVLTVSATGRSGQTVTSSPAGIHVGVGSSAQASFASGTSITLSVSGGRSAVWSGACSSGGNKNAACTFTLNGAATVTANVQ